jgi:ketosteroid isomerase-like protein
MKLPLLAALGVALGIFDPGSGAPSIAAAEDDIANLTNRSAEANSALIRGDIDGYLALIEHAQDYTLMAPFGGTPTHGFDTSLERRKAIARFFKSGIFQQEVVATYGSVDMIVLVTIERIRGEVGGLPEQDWALRVTQVYRREAAEWQLVHRHADPLANGVALEQAAALGRGDRR